MRKLDVGSDLEITLDHSIILKIEGINLTRRDLIFHLLFNPKLKFRSNPINATRFKQNIKDLYIHLIDVFLDKPRTLRSCRYNGRMCSWDSANYNLYRGVNPFMYAEISYVVRSNILPATKPLTLSLWRTNSSSFA